MTFNWDECSDCIILTPDEKVLKAHKTILSRISPLFHKHFFGGLSPSEDGKLNSDFDSDVMEEIRIYAYSTVYDHKAVMSRDTKFIWEFLSALDYYLINDLKLQCLMYLAHNLTFQNCLERFVLAEKCNLNILFDICLRFMLRSCEAQRSSQTGKSGGKLLHIPESRETSPYTCTNGKYYSLPCLSCLNKFNNSDEGKIGKFISLSYKTICTIVDKASFNFSIVDHTSQSSYFYLLQYFANILRDKLKADTIDGFIQSNEKYPNLLFCFKLHFLSVNYRNQFMTEFSDLITPNEMAHFKIFDIS